MEVEKVQEEKPAKGKQAKQVKDDDEQLDLPRALVKRIVKAKLAASSADKKDFQINKDALTAFSESAKVFISFIASTANDICREKKRQTLSADDVFGALQDLEFTDFIEPLKEHLEAFKQVNKEKNKIRHEKAKKRRQSEQEGEQEKEGADAMEVEKAAGDA